MSGQLRTLQSIPTEEEARRIGAFAFDRIGAQEALLEITGGEVARAALTRSELGHLDGDTNVKVALQVSVGGRRARVETHDVSDEGLAALVAQAEAMARDRSVSIGGDTLPAARTVEAPDGLYAPGAEDAGAASAQGELLDEVARLCRDAGVHATGVLLNERHAQYIQSSSGYGGYVRSSYGELSLNVRTASGTGAGWAWGAGENSGTVDAVEIASRAIDLARRSDNPVAVEPGRYTVILEPEAVAQLIDLTLRWTTMFLRTQAAEERGNVFSLPGGRTRIGEQMADPRVQLYYDPYDPILPFSPLHAEAPLVRTHWLRDGVLENLSLDPLGARDRERRPRIQRHVLSLPAAEPVLRYAASLVRASRPRTSGSETVRRFVRWGAGPRAGQALVLGAKARAFLDGRFAVSPDDIARVAHPVLRHRVLRNFEAEAEGVGPDDLIDHLLEHVPMPSSAIRG